MKDFKELNDNELEKVTGGVSADDIAQFSNYVEQIKSILSNMSPIQHSYINDAKYHLNSSVSYLNSNYVDLARLSFLDAIDDLNHVQSYYNNILPHEIGDTLFEARMIMGW